MTGPSATRPAPAASYPRRTTHGEEGIVQSGTIEEHGKGKWRGRYRVRDADGQWKHKVTRICRTKALARQALRHALDDLERAEPAPITLAELVERFFAAHTASEKTISGYHSQLDPATRALGGALADTITSEQLARYVKTRGRKPAYRDRLRRDIGMVYRWGRRGGLVNTDPSQGWTIPHPSRSSDQLPFQSWTEVYEAAAAMRRWRNLVILAVDTGARPGELFALERRHLTITPTEAYVELPGQKTARAHRTVHLTTHGRHALEQEPARLDTPLLFAETDGTAVHYWAFIKRWYRALDNAGLQRRSFYQTRHTYAYFALKAGVPLSDLAADMGHTSLSVTQVYVHWSQEEGRRSARIRSAWADRAEEKTDALH